MEDFSYVKTFLISVSVSFIFLTVYTFYRLNMATTGGSWIISESAFVLGLTGLAAILSIVHGCATGLFLSWTKSDSTIGILIASILAMGIVGLIIFGILFLLNRTANSDSPSYNEMIFMDHLTIHVEIILQISSYIIIPAILTGLINRLLLYYFR